MVEKDRILFWIPAVELVWNGEQFTAFNGGVAHFGIWIMPTPPAFPNRGRSIEYPP